MYLPTVQISAKSVTSIEQGSAESGRGLGAMPPMGLKCETRSSLHFYHAVTKFTPVSE